MVFIEPAPYVLDLLEKGFFPIKDQLDIFFLDKNITQNWNLRSYPIYFDILQTKKQIFHLLLNIFLKRKYQLLHLAGWSQPLNLFLILTSRFFFIPVTVESDTPLNKTSSFWKKSIKKIL